HAVAEPPLHPSQHLNLVDRFPRRHADGEIRIDMTHRQPKIRLREGVSPAESSPVALCRLATIVPHIHGERTKRTHTALTATLRRLPLSSHTAMSSVRPPPAIHQIASNPRSSLRRPRSPQLDS